MSGIQVDLAALESLREAGDYERLSKSLTDDWRDAPPFDEEIIRLRLLAGESFGRSGRLDDMEAAIAPYLEDVRHVPFGLAARVLLSSAAYLYRRNRPGQALSRALLARAVADACNDEFAMAESIQMEGQAHWSMNQLEEASDSFREAISLYAGQSRPYRVGLALLWLGAVLNRLGKIEESRVTYERSIGTLLKCQDDYTLALARLNVATPLNILGNHDTALSYLLMACEKFEHGGHEQYLHQTLDHIAATLILLKEYERAEFYINRALDTSMATRSAYIASSYEIKARLHIARREWDLGAQALRASIEIAEQANDQLQKIETWRTFARFYLSINQECEAENELRQALDAAKNLRESILEIEIKALLAQALYKSNTAEACLLLSDVNAAIGNRPVPGLRKEAQSARKRIDSLDQEHFFILSDAQIPALAEAKVSLLKWLWSRALHKAKGNARDAASILGVTPTYIRKLTKVIPRDLLRPGRKKEKVKTNSAKH